MCLIAFALNVSSRWPLVIAANRDEFLDRPTVPLARWKTPAGQTIVSGRDLRAGGAWFGITPGGPGGRIAFLTNVREAGVQAAPRSRGELVTRWLESPGDADEFFMRLAAEPLAFAGFNLVIGDYSRSQWHWVTNRPSNAHQAKALHHEALKPGVYGLSNAALDSPWPKTTRLKSVLAQSLQVNEERGDVHALQADLWQALSNRERASAATLPATGIALAREEALSSAFVELPEHAYGTRCSTLLTVTADGHCRRGRLRRADARARAFASFGGLRPRVEPGLDDANAIAALARRKRFAAIYSRLKNVRCGRPASSKHAPRDLKPAPS